jgi:sarcosine oxidase, subunit gamma
MTAIETARRGPLDHWHIEAGAEFRVVHGARAPLCYPWTADLRRCAMVDVTSLPRVGFKGWSTWNVLGKNGVLCPSANNTATEQPDGTLCLRLGDNEALLMSDHETLVPWTWAQGSEGCFPVSRRDTHAWFRLLGSEMPSLLSKLCAIDFRVHKFDPLQVAQTSAAGVSTVITRQDHGVITAFHLLVDTSSAAHLWCAMVNAAREYGGRPCGTESLWS